MRERWRKQRKGREGVYEKSGEKDEEIGRGRL